MGAFVWEEGLVHGARVEGGSGGQAEVWGLRGSQQEPKGSCRQGKPCLMAQGRDGAALHTRACLVPAAHTEETNPQDNCWKLLLMPQVPATGAQLQPWDVPWINPSTVSTSHGSSRNKCMRSEHGQFPQAHGVTLGMAVQGQERDSMTPVGPFQPVLAFCDPMIPAATSCQSPQGRPQGLVSVAVLEYFWLGQRREIWAGGCNFWQSPGSAATGRLVLESLGRIPVGWERLHRAQGAPIGAPFFFGKNRRHISE